MPTSQRRLRGVQRRIPRHARAGKYADLVILPQDIFHIPPETISKAHVPLTMVAGKVVYRAPP